MTDFLDRLRTASEGSRDFNRLIEETLPGVLRHSYPVMVAEGYVISGPGHPTEHPGQAYLPPAYTTDLNAALALVERVLPGAVWSVCNGYCRDGKGGFFGADVEPEYLATSDYANHIAPTAPLAVLIALLAALEGGKPNDE